MKPCFRRVALLAALVFSSTAFSSVGPFGESVVPRGAMTNARTIFERTGRGTVAFLGGSITEMNGYRPLVAADLKRRFPACAFTFISAGVSSTCSTTGAFRFEEDVLKKGTPDLLFFEFAVNDDQDAHHTRELAIRGMEGILRHACAANPKMDAVMVLFVNRGELTTIQRGVVPIPYAAHLAVADHYGIPTVNVGVELANRTAAGTFSWERYRDCHPSPEGNQMVADLVGELLDRSNWNRPLAPEVQVADHPSPAPLDRLSYARGCFVPFARVTRGAGWEVSRPDWKRIPGSKRDHYCAEPILWSVTPGAECSFTFEGTAVGAWVTAGGDAGCVEVSIDGGAWRMFDLITSYSAALHYPYTKMFATDLAEGPHTVKLRVAESRAAGRGTAVRIHRLAVNGRP